MSIRFYYDNLVYQSNITVSSENLQFPKDNIKDVRRTKVFKANSTTAEVVFDLLDYREIDSVAIVDSGMDLFGFDLLVVEMNNVDSWATPPVQETVTIDSVNGWANINLPSTVTYRYVRLVLANTGDNVSLGKVFIGKSLYDENICFTYPIEYRQRNNANVTLNRYGQKFFDEISSTKEVKATIPALNKTEMEEVFELLDFSSITRPVWLNFNAVNIMEDANRLNGYYFLNEDPTPSIGAGNFWDVEFNFVEGM
jgi:hypothetical protein